jgi:hypothetical protein
VDTVISNIIIDLDYWYWREKSSENIKQKARKGIRPHPAGFETHDRYTKHNIVADVSIT